MRLAQNGSAILLAEDDLEVNNYLDTALQCQGYAVHSVRDAEEVVTFLRSGAIPIAAVLLDVDMPRRNGIDTLKEIRLFNQNVPVIMLAGSSTSLNVVEAIRDGATDFILKPITPADLRKSLAAALSGVPGSDSNPAPGPAVSNPEVFYGVSPRMRELQNLIGQIGWSEAPVLVQGETGVGKEVFARELHARSPRAKQAFLKLNCAALPSELVESELFGYERGAFTGAFQRKLGMFELADGGTILLDEIGDMDVRLQAKLLQVLQDHEFQRLGAKTCTSVNVRVIAATHRDLPEAIAAGNFRADLYYRLNVITARLPSLRERREDILPMAEFLLRKHAQKGMAPLALPPSLQECFLEYDWPGNVRELENMIRKFVIFRDARVVEADIQTTCASKPVQGAAPTTQMVAQPPSTGVLHLADGAGALKSTTNDGAPALLKVAEAKREAERSLILATLESTNWHRKRAADVLQIDYKALLYKMKVLSIKKDKLAAPRRATKEANEHPITTSPAGGTNSWHISIPEPDIVQ